MSTPTHCPYCALQCGMVVQRRDAGVAVDPLPGWPTSGGGLCQKGWTAAELLESAERLTVPLMRPRRGAPLAPASWDAALDRIAAEIRRAQAKYGHDGVAVLGGGGLTNEKAYQLGKFARVTLRTANIDYNGRFCMSAAATGVTRAFGLDRGLPFPVTDIGTTQTLLLVGGNVAETMPPFMRHLEAQRRTGGRLVVVDPRRTATARAAALHLRVTPGTDLALGCGLLHLAIADDFVDHGYLAARTVGFEAVARSVAAYWPERVERITGVPVADQRAAVRMLAEARSAMIITARGAEQHSNGTDTVSAFINLALVLGLPGTPGSGFGCLTGQGNGQGGREHGQKADQLPGYRRIDDPAARAHVGRVWGVDPATLPGAGRSAYELLDSLGRPGSPAVLLVFGTNPAVSAPRSGHVERRLGELDFLAVSDFVLSETADCADVVLPTTQWAEEVGTVTNLEGRVLLRRLAVAPPAGARSDLAILAELAARLDAGPFVGGDPAAVFAELGRASAGGPADYSGITYDRIAAEGGVFWPCPAQPPGAPPHPGTPRLFLDRFATPDGRARFVPVDHRPAAEDPDADYPLYLTTGRVSQHYQSGAQTRRVPSLVGASPAAYVEVHPDLAARLEVADGDAVRVVSRRGCAVGLARLTEDVNADTVFMPFHWGGAARANLATNPALDPASGMPEFKVCAVRLERVGAG